MTRLPRRGIAGLLAALACALLSGEARAQNSNWVKTGVTGRLIYVPDAEGDRIPDFSMVGYGEGKRAIPSNLPVLIHVDPIAGDNTQHIQNAISFAASRPLQANGFRGVVELGPGKFDVNGHLNITTSGVVLRGSGRGDNIATNTHIVSQNRTDMFSSASTPVINISGSSGGGSEGAQIQIIDKRVPVGAQSFRVASTTGLAVGGKIDVFRPSSAAWIAELGMDQMPDGAAWTSRNLHWHRTITRIEGDRVFVDAPITTAIDREWSIGTVRTYNLPGVIRNVGVENLRGQSLDTREESNELRTPTFIRFTRVDDGFARDIETRHFPYASVFTSEVKGTQHITVDNVTSRLPSGAVTGGRRYTFALDAQMSLVQNSFAEAGRHDFVTGSDVTGPIVFRSSSTSGTRADSGPHHRWGNGLLFDNLDINGNAINVQNRWTSGSGHGWAGANVVVWNSEANSFIVQSPPTAQSWLIGSTGTINPGNCHLPAGVSCAGVYESHGTKVVVGEERSLHDAQKNDAADIREFHWTAASGNWNDHVKWDQEVRPGVYAVSTREYLFGDYDDFTPDAGAGSVDTPFIAPDWQAAIGAGSSNPITGTDNVAANQNVAFTMQYPMLRSDRVIHAYLAMSLKQSGDEVGRDFVQLFDTDPANRLNFVNLGWSTQINATTPFVGAIDMGPYLDKLQNGSVNVQVSDDVAMDWAVYTVAVATPVVDEVGPSVYIDSGNLIVDTNLLPVGVVQNGGAGASTLTIAVGGRLAANDDYVQFPNATLAIEIGGKNAEQFGSVAAGDTAILGGMLRLELAGGFIPSAGDSFPIITAGGGMMGTMFDSAILPHLPGDLEWQILQTTGSVTASVIGTIRFGDLNGDQQITPADWTLFKEGQGTDFEGLSSLQAYLKGDLDGDFDHDLADFGAFKVAYVNAHGEAGFAALFAAVPEPASAVLMLFAASLLFCRRRR